MNKDFYQLLLNYAFRLFTRKTYSEKELRFKLSRRAKKLAIDNAEPIIERVVSRLGELNYVNDKKIVENYFEYNLTAKPCGLIGVLAKMKLRGIPQELAQLEWNRRGISEESLAQEILKRNAGKLSKYSGQKRREKIARLLSSRGFSGDTVWGAVSLNH